MLTWKAEGLPGDELSMQNAVAILHATQSPFIIDPSSQVRGVMVPGVCCWLLLTRPQAWHTLAPPTP